MADSVKNINLLLLTYYYPPEKSGGVDRPYSLQHHLPGHDIQVRVVTAADGLQPDCDMNVLRVQSLKNWRQNFTLATLLYKLMSKLFVIAGLRPECDLLWNNNVKKLLRDSAGFDLVYATHPSAEALELGRVLSIKYGIPFIAEFRDGLAFEPIAKIRWWQKFFNSRFEKIIVKRSSLVITVTAGQEKYFRDKYPGIKIQTVYNGFNQEDFVGIDVPAKLPYGGKIRIAHTGSIELSRPRRLDNLFLAIKKLASEELISDNNWELSFIGNYSAREKKLAAAYGVSGLIKFYDYIPKASLFRKIIGEYDLLLLYGVESTTAVIPGKLFEYFMLDKPILGICAGNESADLIRKTRTGLTCGFDTESIYSLLKIFLTKEYIFDPDRQYISRFDRCQEAGQIAGLIKSII